MRSDTVPCPKCFAQEGEPCRSLRRLDRVRTRIAHAERRIREREQLREYRAAIAHSDHDTRSAALLRLAARLGRTAYLRLAQLAAKVHDPDEVCP